MTPCTKERFERETVKMQLLHALCLLMSKSPLRTETQAKLCLIEERGSLPRVWAIVQLLWKGNVNTIRPGGTFLHGSMLWDVQHSGQILNHGCTLVTERQRLSDWNSFGQKPSHAIQKGDVIICIHIIPLCLVDVSCWRPTTFCPRYSVQVPDIYNGNSRE